MRVTQTAIRNVATIAFLAAVGCGGTGPAGPKGDTGETGAPGENGAPGESGAPGGGYYVDRDDAYCNTEPATDSTVFAECNTPQDLPLMGSCEKGANIIAVLDINQPRNWDPVDTQVKAQWVCGWSVSGDGLLIHIDGASATICCVTHP